MASVLDSSSMLNSRPYQWKTSVECPIQRNVSSGFHCLDNKIRLVDLSSINPSGEIVWLDRVDEPKSKM